MFLKLSADSLSVSAQGLFPESTTTRRSKMTSSLFLDICRVCRNNAPKNGISPNRGTEATCSVVSFFMKPPLTTTRLFLARPPEAESRVLLPPRPPNARPPVINQRASADLASCYCLPVCRSAQGRPVDPCLEAIAQFNFQYFGLENHLSRRDVLNAIQKF